jgi:hypothetical protein
MDRKAINETLSNLDGAADRIEKLAKKGVINPKLASKICLELDKFSDKFQARHLGPANLKGHQAKVIKQDSDEPYMKTFENVNKPLETNADEPFMHKVEKSFNADAIDTFDADHSNTVTDRKEYDVRDLSEWSDKTSPQPSWTGGKGGKSTHQGSTYDAPVAAPKTWA